jgi:hypothetical protein
MDTPFRTAILSNNRVSTKTGQVHPPVAPSAHAQIRYPGRWVGRVPAHDEVLEPMLRSDFSAAAVAGAFDSD